MFSRILADSNTRDIGALIECGLPISPTNQLRNIPDRSILDLGSRRAQRRRKWLASSKNDGYGSSLKPRRPSAELRMRIPQR
jgi:hypothetical protein